MSSIDIAEPAIKAIERVSIENPIAVLQQGALNVLVNMMDFFE